MKLNILPANIILCVSIYLAEQCFLDSRNLVNDSSVSESVKGTSINDVPRFLAFFDLLTYLRPISSLLEKAAYLMTSFFV